MQIANPPFARFCRPIVFVSGCPFAMPVSGLQRRTLLMAELLVNTIGGGARCLLVPCKDAREMKVYEKMGWQVYPLPVDKPENTRFQRVSQAFWCKVTGDQNGEMLRLRGGSVHIPNRTIRNIQDQFPNALFWIYRADYWNLVANKRPGEYWIIDTTDSIYNLQRAYGWEILTRKLFWRNDAALTEFLRVRERRWPMKYDLVVAICRADEELFLNEMGPCRVVRFDTCNVLRGAANHPTERPIELGFLGSDHAGSISAARHLIKSAESGMFGGRELVIGGTCARHFPKKGPGFRNVGLVPDAMEFWRQSRVVILPLLQPTGISVKFQEAVLAGCFVLAINGAAEWSKAIAGVHYHEYLNDADIPKLLAALPPTIPERFYQSMQFKIVQAELSNILSSNGAFGT